MGPWLGFLAACLPAERVQIEVDGVSRSYYLHVPEALPAGAPVVFAFHGGSPLHSDDAGRSMVRFTGFAELADAEGFVAVFPNASDGNWNDGRGVTDTDDVGFVDAVLDDVLARTGADAERVYATGISNGGFFAQRLACDRADRFAAVATVAATFPTELTCAPSGPVRVLFVPGTEDPLVPHEGGEVAFDRGSCTSVTDAVVGWNARNGCTAAPVVERWPDAAPDDGTTVEASTWCAGTAGEIRLLDVVGGGHTWPGGPQYLPASLVGTVSQEFDATEVIWAWFDGGP